MNSIVAFLRSGYEKRWKTVRAALCRFAACYPLHKNRQVRLQYIYFVLEPFVNHTYQYHSTKKPVTTMLTYPWKCTVLHCNHLGNTWNPMVLMTRHFDYCPSASEHGNNQSVRSSAPVVSRCFPGGYNVKLYISRGRLAWWLLAFLHSVYILHESYNDCDLQTKVNVKGIGNYHVFTFCYVTTHLMKVYLVLTIAWAGMNTNIW